MTTQVTAQLTLVKSTRNSGYIACTIVHDDETTQDHEVHARSMTGAQREVTGHLLKQGFTPVSAWSVDGHDDDDGEVETSREFKLNS